MARSLERLATSERQRQISLRLSINVKRERNGVTARDR